MFQINCKYKKNSLIFLLFFLSIFLFSQKNNSEWILAAEKFSLVDTPQIYQTYSEQIPMLILQRISTIKERVVDLDESLLVQNYSLRQKKLLLIKERAALLSDKDFLLLSAESLFEKNQKSKLLEKKILEKEKEIADLFSDTKSTKKQQEIATSQTQTISLWKNSTSLFSRSPETSLAKQLYEQKISALITGTIEDIAGYMFVTLTLETGLDASILSHVSEAGLYDDLPEIIDSLVTQIFPQIARKPPVQLFLDVSPENARVYIDGSLLESHKEPIIILSGTHTITATAEGFETGIKSADFANSKSFSVSITLQESLSVTKQLLTTNPNALIYIDTKYYGESPAKILFPLRTVFGEIVEDDIHTYFLYTPMNTQLDSDNSTVFVKGNTQNTKLRIEKQRNLLYWSLGALYLSLPFSMISYGIATNQVRAFNDNLLPKTQETVDEINQWGQFANISSGISIGLGINYAIQLVRYLIAADQVIPKHIKD